MKIQIIKNNDGNTVAKVDMDGYNFEIIGEPTSFGMTYTGTENPEYIEFEESSERNYEITEKLTDLLYELSEGW